MDWRQAASMLLPLTPEARAGMVPSVESVTAAMAVRLGWRWNGGPPHPAGRLDGEGSHGNAAPACSGGQAGGPRPLCGRSTGAAPGEPAASGAAGGPRDGLSPHVVPNTLGKREQGSLVASDGGRYSSFGQLPRARGSPSELWVWGIPGRAAGGTFTQTASLLGMPGSSSGG